MAYFIQELTPPQILVFQGQIVTIYRNAFSPPPYHKPEAEIADFAHTLPNQFNQEGYCFVGAFGSEPDQMVGFAYGFATSAARWWLEHVRPAMSSQTAQVWLENSYQLVEIAVDPGFQGQGLGGQLHDQLLDGLRYDRAVLSTLQAETTAHHLYQTRGWVVLLEDLFFTGVPRRYQIMGLEL